METKSRYEVIADMEEKKRALIIERDGQADQTKAREKQIKQIKRQLEDAEEDLEHFESQLNIRKETLNELISSIDESLKRFNASQSQKT